MAPRCLCSCSCRLPVPPNYVRRGQALNSGEVRLRRKVSCAARLAEERPDLRPTLRALLASGPSKGHGCAPRWRALAAAEEGETPYEELPTGTCLPEDGP